MTDTRHAALVALALCAVARAAAGDATRDDVQPVESVTGTLRSVSPSQRKLTIDGPAGPVTLEFDRNTSVWLEQRAGTVRDLAVGAEVRAQYGRDRRAAWIEVRLAGAPARPPGGAGASAGPAAPGPPAPERAGPARSAPAGAAPGAAPPGG